jgi:hypothetical protein
LWLVGDPVDEIEYGAHPEQPEREDDQLLVNRVTEQLGSAFHRIEPPFLIPLFPGSIVALTQICLHAAACLGTLQHHAI